MASIRKRGNSWSVEIRKVGFESVRRTFSHRSDAKTWAAETEAEMDRGTYLPNREYLRVTFREALERYEREISSQKKSGETELSRLHRWQRHPLASRFLGALRSVDFAQFRDQRQAEGKSSNTIRLELALVSHLFNVARKEWGYEGLTNPIVNIRLPKPSRARDRRLVGDEAQRLMAALENSRNSLMLPLVQFAIETGARQGEILKLEWRNVDIDSSTIRLLDTIPRPGQPALRWLGPDEVFDKFGVTPDKVVDVQALCGDAVDNVPGVPGIGVKSAWRIRQARAQFKDYLDSIDKGFVL